MHLHDRSSRIVQVVRLCGGAMHFVYDIYKWQTRTLYEFIFCFFLVDIEIVAMWKRERMDARVRTRVHTNESKWKRKWSAFFSLLDGYYACSEVVGCLLLARIGIDGAHKIEIT